MDVAPSEAEVGGVEASSGGSDDGRDNGIDALLSEATNELDTAARELGQTVARAQRAEEGLRAAESLADHLLTLCETPIAVLDADQRVVGWSRGAEATWSVSTSDALGRRWTSVARSVDASATAGDLGQLIDEGPRNVMVSFGDSLRVLLLGDDDSVHHVLVAPSAP